MKNYQPSTDEMNLKLQIKVDESKITLGNVEVELTVDKITNNNENSAKDANKNVNLVHSTSKVRNF